MTTRKKEQAVEPDEVEVPVEGANGGTPRLEIIKAQPGSPVESNIADVKGYVLSELSKYQAFPIKGRDEYRVAKAQRADVRKLKKAIDDKRKELKSEYEAPLKAFEAAVKEVTGPIDDLDASMKEAIDAYEAGLRDERRASLEKEYADFAPALVSLVPFERLDDLRWYLASCQYEAAKDELLKRVEAIGRDERSIDNLSLSDDERAELKADYFSTLDMADALAKARERREQRERVTELERRRQEALQAAEPAPQREEAYVDAADELGMVDERLDEMATASEVEPTYGIVIEAQELTGLAYQAAVEYREWFKAHGIHGSMKREA